jgi:hypothetical protein
MGSYYLVDEMYLSLVGGDVSLLCDMQCSLQL